MLVRTQIFCVVRTDFNTSSFLFSFLTVNFCLSVTGHKLPAKCECYFANDFILNRGKNSWIDFKNFGLFVSRCTKVSLSRDLTIVQ